MKRLVGVTALVLLAGLSGWAQAPAPRAPKLPRITSVDQLVPFAKIVLQRDYIGQRLGWSIRGGEKVLLQIGLDTHPWIIEAYIRALKDLKCIVDVAIQDGNNPGYDPKAWAKELTRRIEKRLARDFNTPPPAEERTGWGGSGVPRPRRRGLQFSEQVLANYDVVVGPGNRLPGLAGQLAWDKPQELASMAVLFPGEINDLMDDKAWAVIRNAAKVKITDLQGTAVEFTWFPEWWEIVEGTHPKFRSPADASTFNALHPGRSEFAVFAGHLMGHPREAAIESTDFRGKIVSTITDFDETPRMTVHFDHGEAVKVEGGDFVGQMWIEHLKLTEDIQFPGYARPGTAWMGEFSVGTNPKLLGPVDVAELRGKDRSDLTDIRWGSARDRAGVYHAGIGARGASWWAKEMDFPINHYHQHLFFVTYEVETRDGKKVKLTDKGHLAAAEDPEVRALAAKYGDPDKLLSEDWIPILTPDLELRPPKAELIPYDEWVKSLPLKLDDPRLVYKIPQKLEKFYGQDRQRLYDKNEYIEFYKKQGVIPVKRAKKT